MFGSEPDRTILASQNGRCFLAFRTTNYGNLDDVLQNFATDQVELCPRGIEEDCCRAPSGFHSTYFNDFQSEMEDALDACLGGCQGSNCLVLTGHSQGGSTAQIAAVALKEYDPLVITFGNAPSVNSECDHVNSSKWIRFVNTMVAFNGQLNYDLIPFPWPDAGAYLNTFGYNVILTDDTGGVAVTGLDAPVAFAPADLLSNFRTHNMRLAAPSKGYYDRIEDLMEGSTYPIRSSGYASGFSCTQDVECSSGRCARPALFWEGNRCD